jgi:pyrroline-5-carboxylate reductase
MLMNKKLSFVGAGIMAEAIITGLLKQKLVEPNQIWVTNNSNIERLQNIQKKFGVNATLDRQQVISNADIILLAMKPKNITLAIDEIRPHTNEQQLFLSVVAGIPCKYISQLLGHNAPIIRVNPNTPAAVSESATALASGSYAAYKDLEIATVLFKSIGVVTTVTEDQIDAVTALSGSGPAYIYYLIEAMEKAGEEIGLEKGTAKQLIVQTLFGAALLIKSSSEETGTLYKQVMSPQGVTEAGFDIIKQYKVQEALIEAIKKGTDRSREIGKFYIKE